jgi:hypothetical protein
VSESRREPLEDPAWESLQVSSRQHIRLLYRQKRTERRFRVITAIILVIAAVAAAWCGFQAARWGGVQSTRYAQASALHVVSARDATLAGQQRLYDLTSVNNWISAYTRGDTSLATLYEKRFRTEFKPTFEAWLALDPFKNPHAPPGPLFMPQYRLSLQEQAQQLDAQAEQTFKQGQAANRQSDGYVFNAIFLAAVLFLTAIAGRFTWSTVRAMVLALAMGMLLYGVYHLFMYAIA